MKTIPKFTTPPPADDVDEVNPTAGEIVCLAIGVPLAFAIGIVLYFWWRATPHY